MNDQRIRLSELIAALSLATDLGLGQPMEHMLRSCLIATRLGEEMGLSDDERAQTYYIALLAWVGCTADSSSLAEMFGDDIALRAGTYAIDKNGLPLLGFMLRRVGSGSPPLTRARLTAALIVTGGRAAADVMLTHCRVASLAARRFGLGEEVAAALPNAFARWDGKGLPPEVSGEDIPLPLRLVQLADVAEVHHREQGVEAAVAMARERSGTQFDPAVVEAFADCAEALLGGLDEDDTWDTVIAAEPSLGEPLSEPELDSVMEALGDFCDLKSDFIAGHSRGVAELAHAAAAQAGLPAAEARDLRRAGFLHDIGRTGIPNTIWDKPGPLTPSEWERVRLHPYYTERMLARPAALARIGAIAAAHHERLDGSGYHRGVPGTVLPLTARILAAADAYHAMTEPRPHRPALTPDEAAKELGEEVRAGRIDAEAGDAVLAAAGHRVRARKKARPADLTAREVEVLVLLARGATNREIARRLVISPKTASNHVERIYSKTSSTTRAEATLFAMRHGLLETLEPLGV